MSSSQHPNLLDPDIPGRNMEHGFRVLSHSAAVQVRVWGLTQGCA
jgi:hypothetical protein